MFCFLAIGKKEKIPPPPLLIFRSMKGSSRFLRAAREPMSCKSVWSPMIASVGLLKALQMPMAVAIFPSMPEVPRFAKMDPDLVLGKKKLSASRIGMLLPMKVWTLSGSSFKRLSVDISLSVPSKNSPRRFSTTVPSEFQSPIQEVGPRPLM